MHTDEYEISIGREISHCRARVRQLEKAVLKMEEKHGMSTEVFMQISEADCPDLPKLPDGDRSKWMSDYRELLFWKKMLKDYEDALRNLMQL